MLICRQSTIPGAGRGVFTTKDIAIGETIEIAPIIKLKSTHHQSTICDYVFNTYGLYPDTDRALILGYVSMYNHSYQNNAKHKFDTITDSATIYAIKPIIAGEELFLNYGTTYWTARHFNLLEAT